MDAHVFGHVTSQVQTYAGGVFLVEKGCTCSWKAKHNVVIASRDKIPSCPSTNVFVQVIFPLLLR